MVQRALASDAAASCGLLPFHNINSTSRDEVLGYLQHENTLRPSHTRCCDSKGFGNAMQQADEAGQGGRFANEPRRGNQDGGSSERH